MDDERKDDYINLLSVPLFTYPTVHRNGLVRYV